MRGRLGGPWFRRAVLERGEVARVFGLVALIGGLGVTVLVLGRPGFDAVELAAADAGGVEVVVWTLGLAFVLLAPVPRSVVGIAVGTLFGFRVGAGMMLVASVVSAVVAFMLSRGLAREVVARRLGPRLTRLDDAAGRRSVGAVLLARLAPVVPFWGFNYAAGLTGLRLRDFTVGTVVGVVPGTLSYAALGAYGTVADPRVLWVGVAGIVMVAVVLGLRRTRVAADRRRSTPDGSGSTR